MGVCGCLGVSGSSRNNGLWYSWKTYPVLIHGVPTSFDMSCDSEDINELLIGDNADIRTHPATLQSAKLLDNTHSQMY